MLQLAVEQVVDDELNVGNPFCLQNGTSGIEQTLVDVGAHDLAGGTDPLAEDPEPAQSSAADVKDASAGSATDRRQELPPGGLPDPRLQLEALQLRGLVGQQVILLRHRPKYLPSGLRWGKKRGFPPSRVRPTRTPCATALTRCS